MENFVDVLWRLFVLFAILFVAFVIVRLFLRRLRSAGDKAVREKYPNAKLIINDAVFFGQESKGAAQARGSGTLALTENELYFLRWLPRAEFRIAIASIQSIETPLTYLGKSYGKKLLKVNFRRDDGQNDSMGWYVLDLDGVKAQIEATRGG